MVLVPVEAGGAPEPPRVLDGERVASVLSAETHPALRAAGAEESTAQVVQRHRDLLEEVADTHRGETVLVLAEASALGLVVPALVAGARASDGTVVLERDAEGWALRRGSD